MFPLIRDAGLPGLCRIDAEALARITGGQGARVLRFRYRPGVRAILHLGLADGREGAAWFYDPAKAQKLAARHPQARFDPATAALFEPFPADHKMPQIAAFLAQADRHAPALMGATAAGPPQLVRYRPGVSATFRWRSVAGSTHYVKLVTDCDVLELVKCNHVLALALADAPIKTVLVSGLVAELGCIAYHAAPGETLEAMIRDGQHGKALAATRAAMRALRHLWGTSVDAPRKLDRAALLATAGSAVKMIALADRAAGATAAASLAALVSRPVAIRNCPIHADIKPEHLFFAQSGLTLIDMERLSIGDPDCDLAALEAQLVALEAVGALEPWLLDELRDVIRAAAGPCYDWFLALARLDVARHFAQRPTPDAGAAMARVLAR